MKAEISGKFPLPRHLAVIMDGNRRWAKQKSFKRNLGHLEGAKNLKKIIFECDKLSIAYLTVYAFSTENWNRSEDEVDELFKLLLRFLNSEMDEIIKQNIKVSVIGDLSKFPDEIQSRLDEVIKKTESFDGLNFNIALNYGSREEIVMAVKKASSELSKSEMDNLDQKGFEKYLYTRDIPDPDLIIRTSGERRLSNFLLWQAAYTELYFSDKLWPEFDKKELHLALKDYAGRERRYGTG